MNVAALVACPTCHALVSETCKNRSGGVIAPHADRLVSRTCRCGGPIGKGRKLCDTCRDESFRVSQLMYARRRRQALRGADGVVQGR